MMAATAKPISGTQKKRLDVMRGFPVEAATSRAYDGEHTSRLRFDQYSHKYAADHRSDSPIPISERPSPWTTEPHDETQMPTKPATASTPATTRAPFRRRASPEPSAYAAMHNASAPAVDQKPFSPWPNSQPATTSAPPSSPPMRYQNPVAARCPSIARSRVMI